MKNITYACMALALCCQSTLAMNALKNKQTVVIRGQNIAQALTQSIPNEFYTEIKRLRTLEKNNQTSWIARGLYTIKTIEKFKVAFDKEKTTLDTAIADLSQEIRGLQAGENKKQKEATLAKLKERLKAFTPIEESFPQAFASAGLAGHNNEYVRDANNTYKNASRENASLFHNTLEELKKYAGVQEGLLSFGGYQDRAKDKYPNN